MDGETKQITSDGSVSEHEICIRAGDSDSGQDELMAKKKDEPKQYLVLIGCTTSEEVSYSVGELMFSDQVDESEIADFLEAGAIEECQ